MVEPAIRDLAAWARKHWPGGDPGPLAAEPLAPDGSARLFVRLMGGGTSLVAMSNPHQAAENRAWLVIGRHLGRLGLPVAPVLQADQARGRFLMKDLGRGSLQEAAGSQRDQQELRRLYRPVLTLLAQMQARGARGLDTSVCFDGAELTPRFLRQREADYFLAELVQGALGRPAGDVDPALSGELDRVCDRAGEAKPRGFVHRDFQSRNIVWQKGHLGLVDFQGGRLGPAQYDLAALLNDPYVDLPWDLRQRLRQDYLELRLAQGPFSQEAFEQGWPFVALSRAMQVLGAYAFLSRRLGRGHFVSYIPPALATLRRLLAHPALQGLEALRRLVAGLPARPDPALFAPLAEGRQ